MARKKLLVILGAGSSMEQGMPSVSNLDDCMRAWSVEWLRVDPGLHGTANYFEALWKNLDARYSSPFLGARRSTTFEDVLADMAALAQWVAPPPRGSSLRQLLGGQINSPTIFFPYDEDAKSFGATVIATTN
jgi:hypothetical protein